MKDQKKTKVLQDEVRYAAYLAKATSGTSAEMALKAYVAGIQYAISVLAGAKAESILPGRGIREAS